MNKYKGNNIVVAYQRGMQPPNSLQRFFVTSAMLAISVIVASGAAQADGDMDMSGMASMSTAMHTATPAPSVTAMPNMPIATPMPSMTGMPGMGSPSSSHEAQREMSAVTNLTDPMSREGSGTSWVPDSSQTFGYMQMHANGGATMEHFAVYPRYVDDGSQRGGRRLDAPNWFMGMDTIPLSPASQLGVRLMTSLDVLSENGFGYPLLYQTGESWHGQPLHDAQHPHDLFSELSGTYSTRLGEHSSAYVYLGYPGEPALGPPTYMHRRIAYDMADAPIGHHWQDATHVTYGVATMGVTSGNAKVEASTFTGREPNEIRTNFDPIHLDSYSTRFSWNAGKNLAAQVSQGYIKSPEALNPLVDMHRTTASLLYNHEVQAGHNLYAAVVFGQNNDSNQVRTNSYLAEFDDQNGRNTYFGRYEHVGKTADDLVIPVLNLEQIYEVSQATLGYVKDISRNPAGMQTGVGAQVAVGFTPPALFPYYGPGTPLSLEIFFRLRPPEITPSNMPSMSMMTDRH